MGNVLAFCEFTGSSLRSNALSNLAFARAAAEKHGGEVIALLVGKDASAAGADAARYAGKVVTVDHAQLEHYMAETYAPIVARLAKEHGAAVVSATAIVHRQGCPATRGRPARRGHGLGHLGPGGQEPVPAPDPGRQRLRHGRDRDQRDRRVGAPERVRAGRAARRAGPGIERRRRRDRRLGAEVVRVESRRAIAPISTTPRSSSPAAAA